MANCSICQNAYGTRHVCQACSKDPANDGWVEGDEVIPHGALDGEPVAFGGVARELTELERQIAAFLLAELRGELTVTDAQIARALGCSRAKVGHARARFFGKRPKR